MINIVRIETTEQTMSSREIADLVEKRHDNVRRTIETLAERGVIQLPQIEEVTNHLGQKVTEYRIGKRDSYVIVAQLSPEFTARLVDRWQHDPKQLHVCHTCDNPLCCNPNHLFLGNAKINMWDKKRKGRARGRYSPKVQSEPTTPV